MTPNLIAPRDSRSAERLDDTIMRSIHTLVYCSLIASVLGLVACTGSKPVATSGDADGATTADVAASDADAPLSNGSSAASTAETVASPSESVASSEDATTTATTSSTSQAAPSPSASRAAELPSDAAALPESSPSVLAETPEAVAAAFAAADSESDIGAEPAPRETAPPSGETSASAPVPNGAGLEPRSSRAARLLERLKSGAPSDSRADTSTPAPLAADDLIARLAAAPDGGTPSDPVVYRGEDPPPPPPPPAGSGILESGDPAADPPAYRSDVPILGSDGDVSIPDAKPFVRAGPNSQVAELFHKSTAEVLAFLSETYPEWIEKGHIYRVRGKSRSVLIFTEKALAEDPIGQQILRVIRDFDNLDLVIERRLLRPRYIESRALMKALVMAGLASVYELTVEQDSLTWKEGNAERKVTRNKDSYIQTGMVEGATSPLPTPDLIPFVYEIGQHDPFKVPDRYTGRPQGERQLIAFDKTSSTEERGGVMVVGTETDIARIQAFVDSVDQPARQIMIEVQVIELDANKLSDFGIDSLQTGAGHSLIGLALPLPGENIIQPGFGPDVRADPEQFVPPIDFEGLGFDFDDTSVDLTGRFLARLHFLVREGDATIKARPKILTLDDRTSVLHIGREEPVFQSTGVTRDTENGNIVNEIRQVTTQYVGFTLNIRPRVSGGDEDEIALQMEVLVNELGQRQRVFEEDLAGIPSVVTRHFVGMNRVKNHRPIILGGLIQEQEVESVNKIPLLADIPLLGYLFRRTQKTQSRNEIILVVTPHILSEQGVDAVSTPKESAHFDTFDSVLFNDRHILKGSDVIGLDPVKRVPAEGFTESEVVDLTLLNIVKKRELVSKLGILDSYFPIESDILGWFQRRMPERTVRNWTDEEQEVFFRAAAIVIENMKQLNEGLTFHDIVLPRRELIVPTSPYRISLSYDSVKNLQTLGVQTVFRDGRVEVNEDLVKALRSAASDDLRSFATFLEKKERRAEDHKELLGELERLDKSLSPAAKPLTELPYPEVWRTLAAARIDFGTLATYFQTNLMDRYALSGSPDVGLFVIDFAEFHQSSVDLKERARRLKELDKRWEGLNSPESKKP
jgi:Flp pilus assembly secretin CpaC